MPLGIFGSTPKVTRLHIGCGDKRLEGWINIDLKPLPGVDEVADVTQGLRYENVASIYAEHFLEHLSFPDGLGFLAECHRALSSEGCLRLSTPNLEWVWVTHYDLEAPEEQKRLMGLRTNRAFYGWGHRFVWNRTLLTEALEATGFEELHWCRYGESARDEFRGVEAHETYDDNDRLPHVLIVEATKGSRSEKALTRLKELAKEELLDHLAG